MGSKKNNQAARVLSRTSFRNPERRFILGTDFM
jgi:hypothetical protein